MAGRQGTQSQPTVACVRARRSDEYICTLASTRKQQQDCATVALLLQLRLLKA